jgi:hypothetical protein
MGLFSRMLLFFMLLAIGEFVVGVQTPATSLFSGNANITSQFGYNATNSTDGTPGVQGSWWDNSLGIVSDNSGVLTIIGIALIVTLFSGFGNLLPILVFVPVAVFFLTFVTYPQSIINAPGMPVEIRTFLNLFYIVLNILFIYSLISWLKGQE